MTETLVDNFDLPQFGDGTVHLSCLVTVTAFRGTLGPFAGMPFVVARLYGSTGSDVNWDFGSVFVKALFQLVETASLVLASDVSGFFGVIALFAKVPVGSEECQAITRSEVAVSFSFEFFCSVTSIGCEEFAFLAFFLASASHRSVLFRIAALFGASRPWSGLPFWAAKSVAALLDFGSFSCAVAVINGHSSSILVDFVAVDDSVLQSLVSTALATLFPFTFKPFCLTVHSLAFLLDFGLSSIV